MNALSLQQQRYLRAIENRYLLPRWTDTATLLADIIKRQRRMAITDNDTVHNFVKVMFNQGRSTNDLIIPANDWITKFRAYWHTEEGLDIPEPNGIEASELINLYELAMKGK